MHTEDMVMDSQTKEFDCPLCEKVINAAFPLKAGYETKTITNHVLTVAKYISDSRPICPHCEEPLNILLVVDGMKPIRL